MVGSLVRFLFTRCEESQTHSFAALTRSFSILHNSWIKIVRTYQPWSNLYISAVEKGEIADSILYQTLDVFFEILNRCSQNSSRGGHYSCGWRSIVDEDGGFARIAIRLLFPNLLYRLFADLQMPAHFRILFQPCSSSGIISTARFSFKSLL